MIKLNKQIISQNHFPDNSLFIKVNGISNTIATIEWIYESDSELFTLICLKKHLENYSVLIDLHLPYVPHARMDRVKNPDDVFTLKYFCEVINSLHFDTVYVRDVHSNVALALLENVKQENIKNYVQIAVEDIVKNKIKEEPASNFSDEDIVFYYPDDGAAKRYSSIFQKPYTYGIKKRDWETGDIQGIKIAEPDIVKNKTILIVDDICSKGGTFYYSSKALAEAGAADIYLYVTHCEETIHKGELLKENSLIKKIYTTDSLIRTPHNKIKVC